MDPNATLNIMLDRARAILPAVWVTGKVRK